MRKSIVLFGLIIASLVTMAQENYAYLSWNYNVPLSNKEWLDTPSPHGGAFGYRYFIKEGKISVGLDLNWTTFDQYEPTQTFPQDHGAITTDYYKYVYQYGGVLTGQYYLPIGESEIFFPYVGFGIGANYNRFTLYYNIYEEAEKSWGFLARPEAGILAKFGKDRSLGVIGAIHYDYSTAKSKDYDYSGFSSVGFKLGIMMMSRY
jgi:hypothetical protein